MSEDLVVLELARQQYALSVKQVREVLPRAALTALPGAPAGVLGVLQLRGTLLPVLDLRQRLGLPFVAATISQCIVVAEHQQVTIGLLVDAVVGITAGSDAGSEETAAPAGRTDVVIRQVAEIDGQVVSILDPEAAVGPELGAYVAAIAPRALVTSDRAMTGETLSTAPTLRPPLQSTLQQARS